MARTGRPTFDPTEAQRETVRALLVCGVPHEQARLCIENSQTGKPLSLPTFRKAFAREIATGFADQLAAVAGNLYRIATAQNHSASTVQACIFWLRCRAGWRFATDAEPTPVEEQRTYNNEAEVEQFIKTALERYGRRCYEHKADDDGRDETPLH